MGKATIRDIAKICGVSTATVTRAFQEGAKISPAKRKLVLKVAAEEGYTSNKIAARLNKRAKAIKLAWINVLSAPLFDAQTNKGFREVMEALRDYKVEAQILNVLPGDDATTQILAAIDQVAKEAFDGVLLGIGGYMSAPVLSKMQEMMRCGITVATMVDTATPEFCHLGTRMDSYMVGSLASEFLSSHGCCNAIIFSGNMVSSIHRSVVDGFCGYAMHSKMTVLSIYDMQENPERSRILAETALIEHPEVDAVYISSVTSIPVCEVIRDKGLGNKIKVVATNTFPGIHQFMQDGVVDMLIYTNPRKQLKTAMFNLYNRIAENQNIPHEVLITPIVVLKSNMSYYLDDWISDDFHEYKHRR